MWKEDYRKRKQTRGEERERERGGVSALWAKESVEVEVWRFQLCTGRAIQARKSIPREEAEEVEEDARTVLPRIDLLRVLRRCDALRLLVPRLPPVALLTRWLVDHGLAQVKCKLADVNKRELVRQAEIKPSVELAQAVAQEQHDAFRRDVHRACVRDEREVGLLEAQLNELVGELLGDGAVPTLLDAARAECNRARGELTYPVKAVSAQREVSLCGGLVVDHTARARGPAVDEDFEQLRDEASMLALLRVRDIVCDDEARDEGEQRV